MRVPHSTLSLIVALGLAACGGAEPTATTPTPTPAPTAAAPAATATAAPAATASAAPATPAPAATAPTGAFSTFTKDQKLQHMKTVIKPTMGALFTAYDPKDFADFGCTTCHGPKHGDTHDFLPKLTLSGDGFQKLSTSKPAVMKFMTEKVMPAMVTAMGEKPYDPATHEGFGCGGCHTVK